METEYENEGLIVLQKVFIVSQICIWPKINVQRSIC